MVKISGSAFRKAFQQFHIGNIQNVDFTTLAPVVEQKRIYDEWVSVDKLAPGGTEKAKYLHDQLLRNAQKIRPVVENLVRHNVIALDIQGDPTGQSIDFALVQHFNREFATLSATPYATATETLHSGELHINMLSHEPDFPYMGFGPVLVHEVERWAKSTGYNLISVSSKVFQDSEYEDSFWERQGFHHDDQLGSFLYKRI